MKIILLADIKTQGKKGDIKDVSEGYARNFLFPKKMAEAATGENIKNIEMKKIQERALEMAENQKNRELAEVLKNTKITIFAKEKGGKLFGSITVKQIIEELGKKELNILPESVIIKKAIKTIGEHEVEINLSRGISVKIKLEVKGN
jgi:large subunit ribosomal protein L9